MGHEKIDKIGRLQKLSDTANARVEKAKDYLPRRKRLKKQRLYHEKKKKKVTKLVFKEEIVPEHRWNTAQAVRKTGPRTAASAAAVVDTVIRSKLYDDEDENLGEEALRKTEVVVEDGGSLMAFEKNLRTPSPYKRVRKLEKQAELINTQLLYEKSLAANPELRKSFLSKVIQKRAIKKRYARAYRATGNGTSAVARTSIRASKQAVTAGKAKKKVKKFILKHKDALVFYGIAGVAIIMVLGVLGTVGAVVSQTGGAVMESTYLSSDNEIYAADEAYSELEELLQVRIDRIETDYPGYDEYRYQVDEITHEPYALISYLTAKYGNFTSDAVQEELEELIRKQYLLIVEDDVEIRTRTETRIGVRTVEDPVTGEERIEEYEYEVEVEYEYYILNVQLTNIGMDAIAFEELNADGKRHYQIYLASLGNRSYLFGDRILVGNPAGGGLAYEIPPDALSDPRFANMIQEAERHLGVPYVWGGSEPSSGFDCSGFVSWVINHCGNGWDYGRLSAEGLREICISISASQAKPGDLIFFEGTYHTPGASHVGIYVGNGMMIHAGNPVQYTSIESSYWQSHFMGFGRLS